MKLNIVRTLALGGLCLLALPSLIGIALGVFLIINSPSGISPKRLFQDTLSLYLELPRALVQVPLRQAVEQRNFKQAIQILERERNYLNWFGGGLYQKHQLVENAAFVANSVQFIKEHQDLKSWLEVLVEENPSSYRAKALLAENRIHIQPEAVEPLIKKMHQDLPVDSLPSRLGIGVAHLQNDDARLRYWHNEYMTRQLGGFSGLFNQNRTKTSSGLRQFFLEVPHKPEPIVAINRGLQLNEKQWYDFEFPIAGTFPHLRIHMPVTDGTRIQIHAIRFHGPTGIQTLDQGQWRTWSSKAYFSNAQLLSTSPNGDVIFLFPKDNAFPKASRIDLSLTVTRIKMDDVGSNPLRQAQ